MHYFYLVAGLSLMLLCGCNSSNLITGCLVLDTQGSCKTYAKTTTTTTTVPVNVSTVTK